MSIIFDLATAADDAALRRIVACNPVPGSISLTYEREPNYFAGCATSGQFFQVPVARDTSTGALAGCAFRAVGQRFVNGALQPVGYLSQLRVDRPYQGQGLTRRAFHYFRELHADGRTPTYLATIVEGNRLARRLLVEQPAPHFPRFRELDRIVTLALLVRSNFSQSRKVRKGEQMDQHDVSIVPGSCEAQSQIIAFMQHYGAQRQFFPHYGLEDFAGGAATAGFQVEDVCVAMQGGEPLGLLGLWDQGAYKQTVVQRYGGALGWLRPAINLAARAWGAQPLPAPGQRLRFAYASFVCVAEARVFPSLLRYALNLAAARGYAFLMLGLSARDPLLPLARTFAHIAYHSRLYGVTFEEGTEHVQFDERIPYVEIATL
ncbi:MAG: hypothetical protein MUD01_21955 [Chloroflexaceae bacterium]|jgi:hypothetical protein|nr:hypothetical protein [Chloroflexaceae bacterium]